jgi:hypothetical protein
MPALDERTATAVINEAKSHGVVDYDMPEDTDERIKKAEKLVKLARRAFDMNERGDHVTAILFTADVDAGAPKVAYAQPKESDDPDEDEYNRLVTEEVEGALPLPPHVAGDVPELPLDLTSLSDRALQKFHGIYTACAARTNWLYAIDEAGRDAAKFIADRYENQYITSLTRDERKDVGGKPKTTALLKAEAAESNSAIVKWRKRQHEHSVSANKNKRLLEIYTTYVESLSRQGTLRQQEQGGHK